MTRAVSLLVLIVLALPAAQAIAAPGTVPPGNSGANQYTETLPGPGGNEPTKDGKHADPAKTLGASNARKLEALGPEGQAAAQLAADTAPSVKTRMGGNGGSERLDHSSSSSGLSQVVGQITGASSDSSGMGLLLPLLIGATILAAVAYALGRRRAGHSPR